MERFVIQFDPDTVGDPNTFWDGAGASIDINTAALYSSLVAARQTAGGLQSQFTDREARVRKVTVTVALAAPPPA